MLPWLYSLQFHVTQAEPKIKVREVCRFVSPCVAVFLEVLKRPVWRPRRLRLWRQCPNVHKPCPMHCQAASISDNEELRDFGLSGVHPAGLRLQRRLRCVEQRLWHGGNGWQRYEAVAQDALLNYWFPKRRHLETISLFQQSKLSIVPFRTTNCTARIVKNCDSAFPLPTRKPIQSSSLFFMIQVRPSQKVAGLPSPPPTFCSILTMCLSSLSPRKNRGHPNADRLVF